MLPKPVSPSGLNLLLLTGFMMIGTSAMAEMNREGIVKLCLSSQRGTAEQCACFAEQFDGALSEDEQNQVVAEFSGDTLGGGLQTGALQAESNSRSVSDKRRACGIS